MSERKTKLTTLDAHNANRWAAHDAVQAMGRPRANGIACPAEGCEGELWDSNPMVTLTSYPAQKDVHCPTCGYRGYRLA